MAQLNLLSAKVGHERTKPVANAFIYNVFYVEWSLSRRDKAAIPKLFSVDRFNILSLNTKDHGARDGTPWDSWFIGECSKRGIKVSDTDTMRLICHPRLFGYAFNPISFWLLHDASNNLRAVLCEVNNTFGDNHNYFISHDNGSPIVPDDIFRAEKRLYVSPFNKVEGHYLFSFTSNVKHFKAVINYFVGDEKKLSTYMGGTLTPLTSVEILKAICLYPLMTFMVVVRIHIQALRLWIKGVAPTITSMPPATKGGRTDASSSTLK